MAAQPFFWLILFIFIWQICIHLSIGNEIVMTDDPYEIYLKLRFYLNINQNCWFFFSFAFMHIQQWVAGERACVHVRTRLICGSFVSVGVCVCFVCFHCGTMISVIVFFRIVISMHFWYSNRCVMVWALSIISVYLFIHACVCVCEDEKNKYVDDVCEIK